MINRFDGRSFLVAMMAMALLLFSLPAGAQRPAPFSQMPQDLPVRVRIDFEKVTATPAFARLSQAMQQGGESMTPAKFVGGMLAGEFDDSPTMPGTPAVLELTFRPPDTPGVVPPWSFLVYGNFEPAQVAQFLQTNGYSTGTQVEGLTSFVNADKGAFVTMPNGWTIAMAGTPDLLGNAVRAVKAPTTGDSSPAASSPVFVAFSLSDSDRAKMKDVATQLPPEAMGMPGVAPLMQELQNLRSASTAIAGSATIELQVNLGFIDDGAAQRATVAVNQAITFVNGIVGMQAASNPEMAEVQKLLGGMQFAQASSSTSARVVLPESMMAQLTQGMMQGIEAGKSRAAAANEAESLPSFGAPSQP